MNITVNNTIETESSVLFNTVESDTYYVEKQTPYKG